MIVGFNEAKLLPACFQSIDFCNDIHYTDLGSTDDSLKVAGQYAQHIYKKSKVPFCEKIQSEVVHCTKNDWLVFIDPDEVVDESLSAEIIQRFNELTSQPDVGAIVVPWAFYFKKTKLRGTVWGGLNHKFLLVNKNRFAFEPIAHYGRKLKPGFHSINIAPNIHESNVLHHYWMSSWKVFIGKHRRYLVNEGVDRYNLGERTTLKKVMQAPYYEFKRSFWTKKGFKDGFLGFFLSLFWAWYQTSAMLSLYKIQGKML